MFSILQNVFAARGSFENWVISLGYFLVLLWCTRSRGVFRPIISTYWYFFPRQVHPTTGLTSQTRLECSVSLDSKLTRLVHVSLSLEILALFITLMQTHRADFLL